MLVLIFIDRVLVRRMAYIPESTKSVLKMKPTTYVEGRVVPWTSDIFL